MAKAQVLGLGTWASLEWEVILSNMWTVPKHPVPRMVQPTLQDSCSRDARTETSNMHSEKKEVELNIFSVKTFLQKTAETFEAVFNMQLEPKQHG